MAPSTPMHNPADDEQPKVKKEGRLFFTQNLHFAMCSKYFVGLVQQSLQEKLCQQEIQLLRMVEEIRENLL